VYSQAQTWSGIINPNRAVNWTNAGVVGGIPDASWTQCGSTIAAYSGTAAAINTALSNCSGTSQYVLLGPGTFTLSTGINFSNVNHVVLRGSGPKSTILHFTAGSGCLDGTADVCFQGEATDFLSAKVNPPCGTSSAGTNCAKWTAGYVQGTTSITLNNVTNLKVGNALVLDQANDTTPQSGVGWFVCDSDTGVTATTCSQQGVAFGRSISGVTWSEEQFVQVTSIASNGSGGYTVGISPGLYATNWSVRGKSPGAWWANAEDQYDGIENMTLDHSDSSSIMSGLAFSSATNSWVTNIRSLGNESGLRNHVWLMQANHITVQSNYFYDTCPSSSCYIIEYNTTSDNLVDNNIMHHSTQPLISGSATGNVYAYNFGTDFYTSPPTYMASDINYGHDTGVYMDLYEGNMGGQAVGDNIHGTTGLATHFRNQYLGWGIGLIYGGNATPVEIDTYSYQSNFVGNVLGKVGYHTYYIDDESAPNGNPGLSIFVTGFCATNQATSCSGLTTDPNVLTSTLLWGNYDVVNAAATWNCTYAGGQTGCPYTHTLPSSFFLSATPSWWADGIGQTTIPFPAIGPDVSGGNDLTGHVYTIPAGLCYANSAIDTSRQTTYTVTAANYANGSPAVTTLTLNSTTGLTVGDKITVTGISPSAYNGTVLIETISGNQITFYPQTASPGTYVSGGSFTWPNILLFDANVCYPTGAAPTPPAPPKGLTTTVH
jgi:hypothetical protein